MKPQSLLLIIGLSIFINACGNLPLKPDELRQLAKNNKSFTSTEKFTVSRPYTSVIKTLKNRSNACLRKSVRTTVTQGGTQTNQYATPFKPTFINRRNMSELHLQMKRGNTIVVAGNKNKVGDDGWYIIVTDIRPVGKNKTQLDIHRVPGMGMSDLVNAIHNWAKGSNLTCPDLTKVR